MPVRYFEYVVDAELQANVSLFANRSRAVINIRRPIIPYFIRLYFFKLLTTEKYNHARVCPEFAPATPVLSWIKVNCFFSQHLPHLEPIHKLITIYWLYHSQLPALA